MVNETPNTYCNTLATKNVALFIVDSKVGKAVSDNDEAKEQAGRSVIAALVRDFFKKITRER